MIKHNCDATVLCGEIFVECFNLRGIIKIAQYNIGLASGLDCT
jgi:hypothetical protein